MTERVRSAIKLGLSAFWLLFTVVFAGWWFVLEMRNVDRLIEVDGANRATYERQRRMIFSEGASWEILLIAGGATLIYLVNRERRRGLEVKEFFASFSHDLKTSIASLRLQAEALNEDLKETPLLTRLVADTVRLQLQLENSLYFSAQDSLSLFYENVELQKLVESLKHQWPDIQIELTGAASVRLRADERALRSVLSNLIQNARVHGKAKKLTFTLSSSAANQIQFRDDGVGFKGDWTSLGKFSHRPTATSGSGLGLYISRTLLAKMNGRLELEPGQSGFGGRLILSEKSS